MLKKYFGLGILVCIVCLVLVSCKNDSNKKNEVTQSLSPEADTTQRIDSIVYETETLIVKRVSEHAYQHISFLQTESFGKVGCNGMIVINDKEAVVFDTPADDSTSAELIHYLTEKESYKITAVIATHFHSDCVGGLETFHANEIPSFASNRTINLLKNEKGKVPQNGFDNTMKLTVGDKSVFAEYFGEGHTKDNIIGYFPDDEVIFGGCLIKELDAGKGYLGDANIMLWSETVGKIKQKHPQIKVVIPGHGNPGGTALFDYTIDLFKQ